MNEELVLEKATKTYNKLMTDTCYEHLTIGTDFSENTDHFGLKEMIGECTYLLNTFSEIGHVNWELKQEDRKSWLSVTGKLKRFIAKYELFLNNNDK